MNDVKFGRRLTAYLIDILIVYLIAILFTNIRFINPNYDKYMEYYEKYNNVVEDYYDGKITSEEMVELNEDNMYYVNKYSISYNIVIIILILAYFILFPKFNNGQTIGKQIMKMKIVNINNTEVSLLSYFLRCISSYYIYLGNVISIIINIILLFTLNSQNYMLYSSIVTYILFGLSVISLILIISKKEKRGIHDYIAKTKVVNV